MVKDHPSESPYLPEDCMARAWHRKYQMEDSKKYHRRHQFLGFTEDSNKISHGLVHADQMGRVLKLKDR